MRMVFSVLGLMFVVAVLGLLARKQLAPVTPPVQATAGSSVMAPSGTPQQQVQQVQKSIESAMQQPRAMPEDETK